MTEDNHVEPCDNLIDLQAEVAALPSKMSRENVSARMLAVVIVVCVTITLIVCAYLKILPGEAIAATIGMLAGRLTSNIGGADNAKTSS